MLKNCFTDEKIRSFDMSELQAVIKECSKAIMSHQAGYEEYEQYVLCQREILLRTNGQTDMTSDLI